MLGLSPIRLLIIGVVALILVGPDKLPGYARQAGAAWKSLREFQEKVEGEVRQAVPDLPRTSDLARYARSPVSLLNRLADHATSGDEPAQGEVGHVAPPDSSATAEPDDAYTAPDEEDSATQDDAGPTVAWGDPSLN